MDTLAAAGKPIHTGHEDDAETEDSAGAGVGRSGWLVMRDCMLDGSVQHPPACVQFGMVHPEIGIALIDLAPNWTPDAAARLRRKLYSGPFRHHLPGQLPIVYRALPKDQLDRFGAILDYAFAIEPPIPPAHAGAWVEAVCWALATEPVQMRRSASSEGKAPQQPGRLGAAPQRSRVERISGPKLGRLRPVAGFAGFLLALGAGMALSQFLPLGGRDAGTGDKRQIARSDAGQGAEPATARPPPAEAAAARTAPRRDEAPAATGTSAPSSSDPTRTEQAGAGSPRAPGPEVPLVLAARGGAEPGPPAAAPSAPAASLPADAPQAPSARPAPDVPAPSPERPATAEDRLRPAPSQRPAEPAPTPPPAPVPSKAQPPERTAPPARAAQVPVARPAEPEQRTAAAAERGAEPAPKVGQPAAPPGAPAPPVPGPAAAAAPPQAPVERSATAPGAGRAAAVTGATAATAAAALPSDMLDLLLRRGDAARAQGDLSAARLLYGRAAEAGNAAAALAVGKTFDPDFLHSQRAAGLQPQPALAAAWYRRAAALGDPDAPALLRKLDLRAGANAPDGGPARRGPAASGGGQTR